MYRAGFVAEKLGVSVASVRSWSTQFSEFLSDAARTSVTPDGAPTQRRYGDDDLALLAWVKALLGQGATFDEARRRLREMLPEERAAPPPSDNLTPPITPPNETTVLALPDMWRAITDAHRGEVEALREALHQAQARAERAEREADTLRAQLAPPVLPPPEPSPQASPDILPFWKRWFKLR